MKTTQGKPLWAHIIRGILLCMLMPVAPSALANIIQVEAWSHDPLIDSVVISPDGSKLAALTQADTNSLPSVTVWETADLSKPPVRFAPDDSKVLDIWWASNDQLLLIGRQKFDFKYGGKTEKWFRSRAYLADSGGVKIREILRHRMEVKGDIVGLGLGSFLVEKPDTILLRLRDRQGSSEYVELNLKTFKTLRMFKGGDRSNPSLDSKGRIAVKEQYKGSGDQVSRVTSLRNPKTNGWEEHFTLRAADREGVQAVQVLADGSVYVRDNSGRDKAVIRPYDPVARRLGKPLFASDEFDMGGVLTRRYNPGNASDLVGYVINDAKRSRVYTDPEYRALQTRIDAALPSDGRVNYMASLSDDLNQIVVRASGTKEAGAWYLLSNKTKLTALGRSFPHLDPAQMSEMTYVSYSARDGLTIPALLTLPQTGKAPHPTVIMPHGGPWARDYLRWSRWVQFLANRGYAVLQPQYRGSQGWGQALWRAGDREWGQKMQDDKDDGAEWLVKQGLADPDRLAMFGYSYGGYAAMAAVVRPDSPYQCAIAGAGLAELNTFDKLTSNSAFQREYQNPTIAGLSPLHDAEKANIPLYLFHGDRDQRVSVKQSRKFYKALKGLGKPVKYDEIPDLWHSNPWFAQHHLAMLSGLETYLAEDCGPGGL